MLWCYIKPRAENVENQSGRPEPFVMHGFPSQQPDPHQALRRRISPQSFQSFGPSPSEAQLGYAQSLERRSGVKMTQQELQD
eukprot:6913042-Alexandrium_andersonii.AAC.1